jgi:hypothetical protein
LKPVAAWIERFSGEMFRARGRRDFISWWTEWRARQCLVCLGQWCAK